MERLVYYVSEISQVLGRSEKSIRQLIHKQDWESVPMPFRLGCRLAWRPADVESFVNQRAAEAGSLILDECAVDTTKRRGPGRPRKVEKQ